MITVILPVATHVPPVPDGTGEFAVQLRVLSDTALEDPTATISGDQITRIVSSRISVQPIMWVTSTDLTVTRVPGGWQYDTVATYTGNVGPQVPVPPPTPPFVGGFLTQSLAVSDQSQTIPAFRAVTISDSKVIIATTAGAKFAGVSISNGNPGGSIVVQLSGPMDPAKFNLGPGLPEAVGIKADGTLVRSTDPACISGNNTVGWCDQTGLVYVYPSVPGTAGLPGPSTLTGTLNASVPINTALTQDPTNAGRFKAGTGGPLPLAGLLMEGGTSGQAKPITVRGPVDPLFHTLNPGVACAVGVNASGIPVRATDPTCVSGLNFIGFCDTAGTIYVAPRVETQYRLEDFGAVPNDNSSTARAANTNAFKAIQAFMPLDRGAEIALGPYNYYFQDDGTGAAITLYRPMRLLGQGSRYKATTQFIIPNGVVGMRLLHIYGGNAAAAGCSLYGIYFVAEGMTSPTAYGVDVQTATDIANCVFESFGGHGVYLNGPTLNSYPDYVRVRYCYVTHCLDGYHIEGGNDNSGGLFDHCDAQLNRGWGFWDHSFLGTTRIACTAAENMRGAYNIISAAGGFSAGCYAESDQAPSWIGGTTQWFFPGAIGAHLSNPFTLDSNFFGGLNFQQMRGSGFIGGANAVVNSTGSAPEQFLLGGTTPDTSLALRVEVVTPGYPAGYDSFHVYHPSDVLTIRYTYNGGLTWTQGSPTRGDDIYFSGASHFDFGHGLIGYFAPYYYLADSVYTASVNGGQETVFSAGSTTGTMSPMSWEHRVHTSGPETDPSPYSLKYQSGLWIFEWANSYAFSGFGFAGGRVLPGPGQPVHMGSLWVGALGTTPSRIGRANWDYAVGSTSWLSSLGGALNGAFRKGDVLFNTGATTRWPVAVRAKQDGGWAINAYGFNTTWRQSISATVGVTVVPTVPNGFVYQCTATTATVGSGYGGTLEPSWPVVAGQTIVDGDITWTCVGPEGDPFESLMALEPYTPTSSADTHGYLHDACHDDNYVYVKTSVGWKRSPLTAF